MNRLRERGSVGSVQAWCRRESEVDGRVHVVKEGKKERRCQAGDSPVRWPLYGTTISMSGPADAWTTGINPAA